MLGSTMNMPPSLPAPRSYQSRSLPLFMRTMPWSCVAPPSTSEPDCETPRL